MKLGQIENLYSTLSILKDREMPIRLAYKFSTILSSTENDYDFYMAKLRQIITKYAEKDENGNIRQEGDNIKIQSDFIRRAEQELKELSEMEITLSQVTFTLEELESLKIKPSQLQSLLPFIKE